MEMEPFLYHGIRDYNIDKLINILKVGYVLPNKMLEKEFRNNNKEELSTSGNSWICVTQKSLYDDYYGENCPSTFDLYIYNHPCIVIDNNIKGIKYPTQIVIDFYGREYLEKLIKDDSEERYSPFMDELQTNIPIPKDKFLAIGYPTKYYNGKYLSEIEKTLKNANLDIPIVDSSIYEFADSYDNIKKYTLERCSK
ncbi:MAG: hypothetical protein IJ568_01080 [Bacilli bacterium]|nr:hypothetical protein [Bacilli bacterium]